MNPVARQLSDLKFALQELESAVQQPRDEGDSVENVLERFPRVLIGFGNILRDVLSANGYVTQTPADAITEAHSRGWLKGDLSLWLRLLSDHQEISSNGNTYKAKAIAQDVRACSCMFWETFELLTARFRYQTQAQPSAKSVSTGKTLPRIKLQAAQLAQ